MESNFKEAVQERAILVGLNADCFTQEETATEQTLEELDALLQTAGGFCTAKFCRTAMRRIPTALSVRERPRRCGCWRKQQTAPW